MYLPGSGNGIAIILVFFSGAFPSIGIFGLRVSFPGFRRLMPVLRVVKKYRVLNDLSLSLRQQILKFIFYYQVLVSE